MHFQIIFVEVGLSYTCKLRRNTRTGQGGRNRVVSLFQKLAREHKSWGGVLTVTRHPNYHPVHVPCVKIMP